MIVSIVIGRKGSIGFPNKNKYKIGEHPMLAYPIIASNGCKDVDEVFYSTDDLEQAEMAEYYGAIIIDRPPELATNEALGEDVFVHAYNWIKGEFQNEIELVATLFASAPCITSYMMTDMIRMIRKEGDVDSCCSISEYLQFSPYRMKKIKDGYLVNWLEDENYFKGITCDRNSGINSYIYDISCAIVRPYCLEYLRDGIKPMRWLGRKTLPYNKYNEIPRCDIDFSWQIFQVESWIDKYWEK